ncbi:hypothetical protein MRX96_042347 [Rhipicephalus microplus]
MNSAENGNHERRECDDGDANKPENQLHSKGQTLYAPSQSPASDKPPVDSLADRRDRLCSLARMRVSGARAHASIASAPAGFEICGQSNAVFRDLC